MWPFRRRKKLFSPDPPLAQPVAEYRLLCDCFAPLHSETKWCELALHNEQQDTECDAWKRLVDLVELAAEDGRETLQPVDVVGWSDWSKILTLPRSIAKLKAVKVLILYGSSVVRIPPEIGEMESLEKFDPYTSYRLHWLPYEITRCSRLVKTRVSTRALYGNYKHRPPFPRLPHGVADVVPSICSVCRCPFAAGRPKQRWVSLRVGTDVLPLLAHACSNACIDRLPTPAKGYVQRPHRGGLGLVQPDEEPSFRFP